MAWTLRDLIIASGFAGTSGQSFRNHVVGAASGAKMSDYKQTAASWDVQTFPGLHNPNESYTCTITFTEGSRARFFRNSGNVVIIDLNTVGVIKSGESLGFANSGTVTVTVDGNLDIGGAGVSSITTVPASPFGSPGQGGSPLLVRWIPTVNSISSGSDFKGWRLTLPRANTGYPFNTYAPSTGIAGGQYEVEVRRKAPSITDYDFEWYNDSFFSSLFAVGSPAEWTQSFVGQDKTLWLQWRIKPALNGGNTTWHQILTGTTFTDRRA